MEVQFSGENFFYDAQLHVWVKGYAIFGNKIFKDKDLAQFLYSALQSENFEQLNGQFAAVSLFESKIRIISDQIRSIPLYYQMRGDKLFIADSLVRMKEMQGFDLLDFAQEMIFAKNGFCTTWNTLFGDIKQTQAAEIVRISPEKASYSFYLRFPASTIDTEYAKAKEQLKGLIFETFENYLPFLRGKKVLLPLSSGLDSRLIAYLLKKSDFKNVLCFTFGRKSSFEIQKSKKVAEMLGFDWVFVNYEDPNVIKFDAQLYEYLQYAANASAMPYLQDYFAIKYLKNLSLADENSVFMPGHSADFLAGSHLRPWLGSQNCREDAQRFIEEQNSFFSHTKNILIQEENSFSDAFHFDEAWKVAEEWDFRERQTKLIVNSARVFSFFQFEYLLFFWDRRWIEFFGHLPYEIRLYKKLYDDVLNNLFLDEGIWFPDDKKLSAKTFRWRTLKNIVNRKLPEYYQRKKQKAADWMNYEFLTQEMRRELLDKKLIKNKVLPYNYILSLWYLEFLKSKC